jgi:hypothetical protein
MVSPVEPCVRGADGCCLAELHGAEAFARSWLDGLDNSGHILLKKIKIDIRIQQKLY